MGWQGVLYWSSIQFLGDGVLQYCSNARANLFLSRDRPRHADRMIFFMDFTVALAFPLLSGYLGVEVTYSKPHCFANFWKAWDVNCGPWSVHTLSGAPVQQNDDLRADTSFLVVVLVIIGVISSQSEKQCTVMRYCCPACEQKYAVIS